MVARTAEAPLPSGAMAPGPAAAPTSHPVPDALDRARVPVHVAWALGRGDRASAEGEAGTALLDVVDGALVLGIRWLTVYAVATGDWERSPEEVERLLDRLRAFLDGRTESLAGRGVRLRLAGRPANRMPGSLAGRFAEVVRRTAGGDRLTLTLALNYDGRTEIVDAIAALAAERPGPDGVDEAAIGRHLYHPDMPDPDLVIRTSAEQRISDLLLWEMAYSELVFVDVPWSAVRRHHLYDAVLDYQRRDRRYGGLDPAGPRWGGPR
ncbi:MAG TPA: polyprenyl diphosphate synthase [Acidimicrobiales bacterium]|jgi:undecaprenyl diphosphate synthase|nr:polyprenyl diphosphate synthase [Acidimicrobiales bacterium]